MQVKKKNFIINKDTSDALIHRVFSINSHCDFFCAASGLEKSRAH